MAVSHPGGADSSQDGGFTASVVRTASGDASRGVSRATCDLPDFQGRGVIKVAVVT